MARFQLDKLDGAMRNLRVNSEYFGTLDQWSSAIA
jgi:hypothetical protein